MKRAVLVRDVNRQAWADSSLVALPPTDPFYVTGPRGGRYVAVPPWTRTVSEAERWDMNLLTVVDQSAGVRYIRPRRGATVTPDA